MKRRTLLELGAAALVSTLAPRVARAESAAVCERVVARVGANHEHVFEVAIADVTAGLEKTYDLTGAAGHAHAVTLGPEHFARLRAGEIVRLPSTRTGHVHRLLVRCGPAHDPPDLASACDVELGGKDDHELLVTEADVRAGKTKTFDIQGIAPHAHEVTLEGAHVEKLLRGEQVLVSSTLSDGHGHRVYVRSPKKP